MFLLPGRVPHSPRRYPGSMGLVIEREREPDERDALRYYCKDKETILHQRVFFCQDLGKELGPIIKERINRQLNPLTPHYRLFARFQRCLTLF